MSPTTSLSGVLVVLCICAGIRAQDSSGDGDCDFDFDYTPENGPSTWGEKCSKCNGKEQSPINIDTSEVQVLDLPDLDGSFYENRNKPYNFRLSNDGYTVTLVFETPEPLILQGGPLDGTYTVSALQFCWGSNDSVGSEHTFNGERFPLESQWVLKRKNEDGAPDSEMRIAQLYRLTDVRNAALSTISSLLGGVIQPGSQVASCEPITYNTIYSGYPVNDYYHYNGSLTTPPCTEGIPWLVYPPGVEGNGVTEDVLASFRELKSENGPLVNNFRPLQELNDRVVVASSKSTQLSGGGSKCCGAHSKGRRHSKAGRHGAPRRQH